MINNNNSSPIYSLAKLLRWPRLAPSVVFVCVRTRLTRRLVIPAKSRSCRILLRSHSTTPTSPRGCRCRCHGMRALASQIFNATHQEAARARPAIRCAYTVTRPGGGRLACAQRCSDAVAVTAYSKSQYIEHIATLQMVRCLPRRYNVAMRSVFKLIYMILQICRQHLTPLPFVAD